MCLRLSSRRRISSRRTLESTLSTSRTQFTSPVVDYEPPPVGIAPAPLPNVAAGAAPLPNVAAGAAPLPNVAAGAGCPPPSSAALHRHTPRLGVLPSPTGAPPACGGLRPVPRPPETPLPPAAAVFAEAALRRVLEVIDRRRPVGQLRPLLTPPLIDTVGTLSRSRSAAAATLRRVRLRSAGTESRAAEVFATYTRGDRVRAIAARIELTPALDRWQVVALQIG
jgi:hypothetical protein